MYQKEVMKTTFIVMLGLHQPHPPASSNCWKKAEEKSSINRKSEIFGLYRNNVLSLRTFRKCVFCGFAICGPNLFGDLALNFRKSANTVNTFSPYKYSINAKILICT
jgi:hypothetical protein